MIFVFLVSSNILYTFLGNDNSQYYNTRHNIAHMLFLHYAKMQNFKILIDEKLGSYYFTEEGIFFFAKSLMNNCGDKIYKFYKKNSCNKLVVIHDDLETKFLKIKIKYGGSENGHNGLRSISSFFGKDYDRIKVGIGRPIDSTEISYFVLKKYDLYDINLICSNNILNVLIEKIQLICNSCV